MDVYGSVTDDEYPGNSFYRGFELLNDQQHVYDFDYDGVEDEIVERRQRGYQAGRPTLTEHQHHWRQTGNMAQVMINDKAHQGVFKTKSKKEKSDCLNLRKTLLGTSPRLVILKSAEDLCIKGFDISVKKHKQGDRVVEPKVSERLLVSEKDKSAALEHSSAESQPQPQKPAASFCCKYPDICMSNTQQGSLLASSYLPVEPTTGHNKDRCVT
ncbi:hypothetical protein J6590_033450 [Homalodisca vitripennis]|nr:hypothetical protein J6590_033450 [Homalodisca vitripennis]